MTEHWGRSRHQRRRPGWVGSARRCEAAGADSSGTRPLRPGPSSRDHRMPRHPWVAYNWCVTESRGPLPVDLIVIDNLDVVRAGLQSLTFSHPAVVRTVRAVASIEDLDVTERPVPVVVLDYWLGRDDENALDAVAAIKGWGPAVLLYTSEERPHQLRLALQAGVDGLCLKNDGVDALVAAIAQVSTGSPAYSGPLARAAADDQALRVRLTKAETTVLEGLSYGLGPAEIAERLHVTDATVKTHERHIHDKYRQVTGQERVTRARLLFEALRDGYWDTRSSGPNIP